MDKNKLIISAAVVLMASTGIMLAANSGNSSHVTLSGLAGSETYTLTINSPLYTGSSESGVGTTFVQTTNGNNIKIEYNKLSPFVAGGSSPYQTGFNSIKLDSYIDIVANGKIEGLSGISSVTVKWCDSSNTSLMRVHYGWEPGNYMNYIEEKCSPFTTTGIHTFNLPNGPSYIRIDSTQLTESSGRYTLGLNEISIKYSCVKTVNPYVVGEYCLDRVDDHFEVVRYTGSSTSLDFPNAFEGHPITAIADDFAVDIGKNKITSVTLPASITKIGASAFYGASKLETIDLSHVTTIGYRAFMNCSKLGSTDKLDIYAPQIGEDAFCQSGVTEVDFHSSTGRITTGETAFVNCHSLATVLFDDDLTLYIGSALFDNCDKLTTIKLPVTLYDTLYTAKVGLNKTMFYDCSSLSDIQYAGTVEQWGNLYKPGWWSKDIPQSTTQVYCIASDAYTNLGRKDNG